jgi:predicted DsbA family dithiol-disulfide isomerase
VPLASHPHAYTAARAAVCAEVLATPGDYAAALFEASALTEEACEELAASRGTDREAFRRCLRDPATAARIERDTNEFESIGGDGVPLLYVGRLRLEGEQSQGDLETAIARSRD